MKFDINEVMAGMLTAIKVTVSEDWPLVQDAVNVFLSSRKERLDLLASLRLDNEISQEFFDNRIKDEEKILESELHALVVITKSIAQKAANAAMDVLSKAVSNAIGTIF